MLPATPWYISLILAIIFLVVAFVSAHIYSKQPSRAYFTCAAWLAAVTLGLNAIYNFNSEVATVWGFLGAIYAFAILFGPFTMAPPQTNNTM